MRRRRAPMARPAALARQVLEQRGIREPSQIDLLALADDLRVVLRRARLGNAEGRLVRCGRCGVVTIDEGAFLSEKWLFVLAHELGHLLLHEHRAELACFLKKGATREAKSRSFLDEEGASGFGVELTMPASMVEPRYDRGASPAERARALASTFGMSLPVSALRMLDFTEEPCAVAYAEAGRLAWCTATRAFGVKVRDGARVSGAVGEERVVRASAWGEAGEVRELREHAMAIPGFDAVLTVMWHEG